MAHFKRDKSNQKCNLKEFRFQKNSPSVEKPIGSHSFDDTINTMKKLTPFSFLVLNRYPLEHVRSVESGPFSVSSVVLQWCEERMRLSCSKRLILQSHISKTIRNGSILQKQKFLEFLL